jgi:hypothetical protein
MIKGVLPAPAVVSPDARSQTLAKNFVLSTPLNAILCAFSACIPPLYLPSIVREECDRDVRAIDVVGD